MSRYIDKNGTKLNDRQIEIIIALADNNMNITETARLLYLHRNTLSYHLQQIKKITGLNPTRFYDLLELLNELKKQNIQLKGQNER